MRLSINGWPPVASHLVCLLIGIGIANLSISQGSEEIALPSGSLILTLKKSGFKSSEEETFAVGDRVFIGKRRITDGRLSCRVSEKPLVLIAAKQSFSFRIGYSALSKLRKYLGRQKSSSLSVVSFAKGQVLPICDRDFSISFGVNN